MVARTSDQLGRLLGGRYRLVAAIGAGASAQVFLADDTRLQRKVAVKVLHPALATDEAFLRRFRDEARAAAALSHPNLMAVYDWGEDDGPYLVLEYLGGGSLRALLDRGHRLTPSQALVVGLEAARALDVAHRRGFVHRDIKPANLLFGEDGRLRIADFGLARALSEAGWTEPGGGLVGTARYAAPEQATGSRVDGKADVYALGLVLIESVTGAVPLTSPEGALQTMTARASTAVPVPDAMAELKPILERLGVPDPAARPDAGELGRSFIAAARTMARPDPLPLPGAAGGHAAEDITVFPEDDDDVTLLGTGEPTGLLPAVEPRPRSPRRWGRWVVGAAIAALIGVVAGLVYTRISGPTAPVPAVVNLPVAEAKARIADADRAATKVAWKVKERHVFADGTIAGMVLKQHPLHRAADGATITLTVSDGPHPVTVPGNLQHQTVDAATAALHAAGLEAGDLKQQYDENEPKGNVLSWSYQGHDRPAQVPKGQPVDLIVSNGPQPRTIPDLANDSQSDAESQLKAAGLNVTYQQEFSDTVEAGKVTRTDPAAGKQANKGDTVTVYISKGPDLVVVPDVSKADTLEGAVAMLEQNGLQAGNVYGNARGHPYVTDPPAGTKAKRNSAVDIYLRK